jgi:hypothetical protein
MKADLFQQILARTDWATVTLSQYQDWCNDCDYDQKKALQGKYDEAHPRTAPRARGGPFTAGDIQGDDLGAAPFANQAIPVTEFGVRWWFQYFWQEAKMVATSQDRAAMAGICNELFVKTPAGPNKYKVKDDYAGDDADTNNTAKWLGWMEALLEIGFSKVDTKQVVQTGPAPLPIVGPASHHLMLQTNFSTYVAKKGEEGYADFTPDTQIYWRGETRPPQLIRSQGGAKRQSMVDKLRTDMNIKKDWHPFAADKNNQYLWYRKGQNDNDYYTVISVGMNFETALCFPKIDEKRVYSFPARPVDQWSQAEALTHRANLALVVMEGRAQKVLVATKTTTYMCVVRGRILDTKAKGGGFPEKGVEEIPLDQIYALIPVTRIHLGQKPEDGLTAFVDYKNAKRVEEDIGKAHDLFGGVYKRLFDEYYARTFGPAVTTNWTGAGPGNPTGPKVVRIVEFPIGDKAFNDFKGTLKTV